MSILVTGAAGFIGYHLIDRLCKEGMDVIGIDNYDEYYDVKLKQDRINLLTRYCSSFEFKKVDIRNTEEIQKIFVEQIFKGTRITKVCHLAAVAGVRYSIENPKLYIDTNINGFQNVIDVAKNNEVENFVYASSSSVYGNNPEELNREGQKINKPVSLYAATKAANELLAYYYHDMFKLSCTGLRFHTVYGPWGRPDMALHLFADGISKNHPIKVFNHGDMIRDFTYIDDIIDGVVMALSYNYANEVFNLGSGREVNLLYYIECLEKAMGKEADKIMMAMQPGDVYRSLADVSYARERLRYIPKVQVEEGIPKFVEWYKEYYGV